MYNTNKHNKQTHIRTQTDADRTTLAYTTNVHCIVYNTQISSARYVYELSCIIWDPALASVIAIKEKGEPVPAIIMIPGAFSHLSYF